METVEYTKLIEAAYQAIDKTPLSEKFKELAFKLVLESMLTNTAATSVPQVSKANPKEFPGQTANWKDLIANKLDITAEQVESLYYFDDTTDTLRLVIDHKKMPKSLSGSTQHIAALLAAGRQAMKLDEGATDYDTIRVAAKEYGVFNSSNFTAYIKALGSRFMISGNGQNQAVQLTLPAYARTGEIARQYLGGE